MTSDSTVTRFAPSPTGYLHFGHVRSALEGWRAARGAGGRFLLRLEDIDQTRCRDEYTAAILEDLDWLGLSWDGPVRKQSEHLDDYRRALERLQAMEVIYPCFCTRREIRDEIARAGGAPHALPGLPYPGTCRGRLAPTRTEAARRDRFRPAARSRSRACSDWRGRMGRRRGGWAAQEAGGSRSVRRCRSRSQGRAGQLSLGRYRRRRDPEGDSGHAR